MARELADARLLTLNGYGHTALDNPSTCIGKHAVRYFLSGVRPPAGAHPANRTSRPSPQPRRQLSLSRRVTPEQGQ